MLVLLGLLFLAHVSKFCTYQKKKRRCSAHCDESCKHFEPNISEIYFSSSIELLNSEIIEAVGIYDFLFFFSFGKTHCIRKVKATNWAIVLQES